MIPRREFFPIGYYMRSQIYHRPGEQDFLIPLHERRMTLPELQSLYEAGEIWLTISAELREYLFGKRYDHP